MFRNHDRPTSFAIGIALAIWLFLAGTAIAQVPQDSSFSGRLVTAGVPVVGPVDFDLLVYDGLTGGTVVFSERHTGVSIETDGSFSVLLGGSLFLVGVFDASLFSSPDRYIEVAILSPVAETLAPRVPIASAPWALVADTVLPQAGTVSVGGLAFTDELAGEFFCLDNKSSGVYFTFRGTGTECDADAPIQLPDGVTVLSMSCTIFDDNNVGEGGISVALRRVRLSDGASGDVFITPASTDTGTVATYTDVGASFGTGLIDNSSYAYSLRADFGIGLPSSLLRLYGCSVDYE